MATIAARSYPHNLEVERAILGSMLLDSSALNLAAEHLTQADFFSEAHRLIFEKALELSGQNRTVDLVTMAEVLGTHGLLEKVGGAGYLASLTDGVPVGPSSGLDEYCRILTDKARLRRIIRASNHTIARCLEGAETSEDILANAVADLLELDSDCAGERARSYRQVALSLIEKLKKRQLQRVMTGVGPLDELTGGFLGGELVLYTAETGVGKTLLAQQTRRRACRDGLHSLFVSAEMTAEHLVSRELAASAGVKPGKMRRPEAIYGDEWEMLTEAVGHQCERCRILDGDITMGRTTAAAKRMKAEGALDLVIVDYDELVTAPGRTEIEQQAAVATGCKRLAGSLQIPVILISQLRKLLSGEDRKRPTLSRLYGSGAKVKHANIIVYVNREYVQTLQGSETDAELVVLKSRDGRQAKIKAYFNVHSLKFAAVEEGAK